MEIQSKNNLSYSKALKFLDKNERKNDGKLKSKETISVGSIGAGRAADFPVGQLSISIGMFLPKNNIFPKLAPA